jgi:2,4-dienoyl-CoA reductase-like NADH-dependent reductase (Old Yellow Enzyme family)/NADPH-dependent 2,4-dienoyl-CoA reductase/sulfur reductase-like enzyme
MFPRLFSPLAIGNVTLANRIVSSGHDTVMADHGQITDRLIAYHEARARGGAGLIVVQVAGIHQTARYTSHVMMATDDSCIPGYRALAEAVKPHGTKLFGQLFHPGREVMDLADGTLTVAVAPSAVPTERFRVMPRPLRLAEIREIADGYGRSAQRLQRAGLDGVEVVASHGYLPSQFLNPAANRREDEYGGSPENRLRFLREAFASIRRHCGPEFVAGLRISLDERDPSGLPADIAFAASVALAEEGLADYLNVTTGTSASLAGSDHIAPDMSNANGYVAPLSAKLRAAVTVPVLVAGRINQPQEAEQIIAAGQADACVMTRALICDPEMPGRAKAGQTDDIRACIGCNQACIGHFHLGFPISCIQHPETGRERLYGIKTRADRPKKVMVVGGGPAGLKAAAVAAERGHDVTLYEAGTRLGGQVLLAERLPGREEFGGAITNLSREAARAGVKVHLRTAVDLAAISAQSPDLVVVATGAEPYRPPLEIADSPWIADAWEVIRHPQHVPEGKIVVADSRGDWVGLGAARLLAAAGHAVTLAVTGYAAGESLQQYVRDRLLAAVARQRITVLPLVRPYGVDDDTVYLQHVLTEEPVLVEGVAGLVLACGASPAGELLATLDAASLPAVGIGDCLAPRTVEEAVLDGLVAASAI